MHPDIALELLVQRGRSVFYTELVDTFQKAIDSLKSLENRNNHNAVFKKLRADKLGNKLKAIVIKNTGMPITNVAIGNMESANLFCITMSNKKFIGKLSKTVKTKAEILGSLGNGYDDKSGSYTNKMDPNKSPYLFAIVITSAMFSNPDFSADEMAALFLHEVGHADRTIRLGIQESVIIDDAADVIDYLATTPSKDELEDIVIFIRNNCGDDRELNTLLDSVQNSLNTLDTNDRDGYGRVLNVLSVILTSSVALDYRKRFEKSYNINTQRRSTNLFSVDTERAADEFSARHGSAGPLISVIGKLDKLDINDVDRYLVSKVGIELPVITGVLKLFRDVLAIRAEETTNGYDPILRRMELVVETAKHAFSNTNLTSDEITQLKEIVEDADKYLKEYQSSSYRQRRVKFKQWKDNIIKFGTVVAVPFATRLTKDYTKLQESTRSLSRNPLYYLAHK